MIDDIVTRLRRVTEIKRYNDLTDEVEVVATFTKSDDSLEAADEIERLRADRDRWRKIAELAREAWHTDNWLEFNDAYVEAMRDD